MAWVGAPPSLPKPGHFLFTSLAERRLHKRLSRGRLKGFNPPTTNPRVARPTLAAPRGTAYDQGCQCSIRSFTPPPK